MSWIRSFRLQLSDLNRVGVNLDLACEFRRRDTQFRQLFLQYLAGMDGSFQQDHGTPTKSLTMYVKRIGRWYGVGQSAAQRSM